MHSSRLDEKILLPINDKPMIQWVYEAALKVKNIQHVCIAADDEKTLKACNDFGANVHLTSVSHQSGTDRMGEIATKLPQYDYFINMQADEPLINPLSIERLAEFLISNNVGIATMYDVINNENDLFNYNVVKLVKDLNNNVLYFSRNAVPAHRDLPFKDWIKSAVYYMHVGIYGFKRNILMDVVRLPVSDLEKSEKLEQLRWLENGFEIKLCENLFFSKGVDTREDYEEVLKLKMDNS